MIYPAKLNKNFVIVAMLTMKTTGGHISTKRKVSLELTLSLVQPVMAIDNGSQHSASYSNNTKSNKKSRRLGIEPNQKAGSSEGQVQPDESESSHSAELDVVSILGQH